MKLRDFIEQLQQLDQDADVRCVCEWSKSSPPEAEDYVEPEIQVKDIKGRRVVCIQ